MTTINADTLYKIIGELPENTELTFEDLQKIFEQSLDKCQEMGYNKNDKKR